MGIEPSDRRKLQREKALGVSGRARMAQKKLEKNSGTVMPKVKVSMSRTAWWIVSTLLGLGLAVALIVLRESIGDLVDGYKYEKEYRQKPTVVAMDGGWTAECTKEKGSNDRSILLRQKQGLTSDVWTQRLKIDNRLNTIVMEYGNPTQSILKAGGSSCDYSHAKSRLAKHQIEFIATRDQILFVDTDSDIGFLTKAVWSHTTRALINQINFECQFTSFPPNTLVKQEHIAGSYILVAEKWEAHCQPGLNGKMRLTVVKKNSEASNLGLGKPKIIPPEMQDRKRGQ